MVVPGNAVVLLENGQEYFPALEASIDARTKAVFRESIGIPAGNIVDIEKIGDIARKQRLSDNDAEYVDPQDMLAELRADNLHLVESLRRAKDVADQAKDNATSGLIDTWTDEAERRAWFLFEVSR